MPKKRIYVDRLTLKVRALRILWFIVYFTLFRLTPRPLFWQWRVLLLKVFGAKFGYGCKVDPTCIIWAPWNLVVGDLTCIAGDVDLYAVDKVKIGSNVAISQRSFICTASHDISSLSRPLNHSPIIIEDHVWVCAESFIAPGITVGEGAVVGARAAVFNDVESWTVVGGNPAKFIKKRVLRENE